MSAFDPTASGPAPPHGVVDGSADTLVEGPASTRTTDRLNLALPGARARMGRFVLLDRIGAGAMGVVYAAYDATLDRKVAIKVIRGEASEEDRRRIRREAQAMARLSHAHVARIYEAGELDGRLYLAMEFIDGEGLDGWQAGDARSWRAVLDQYRAVGAGLAAAHAAGILHRDFKPHNVLVDRAGHPRVIDFGLARAAGAPVEPSDPAAQAEDALGGADLHHPVTRAGAVVGTPAYMAPEQFTGRPLDARADQFAFCVALYEALYRQPPFPRRSLRALLKAIGEHRVAAPPTPTEVPRWLHDAIARGLAPDPEDRWPSMDALLAELGRDRDADPDTGRLQRLALVVAVAVVGIGTSVVAATTGHFADPDLDIALGYGLAVAGVTAVGLLGVRRAVLATRYNRMITSYFVTAVGLVAASRVVSWHFDASGLVMYTLENVGLTALSLLGALHVARWLWSLAASLGLGVVLTLLWPEHLGAFYASSISIACALAVFFTLDRRSPPETP